MTDRSWESLYRDLELGRVSNDALKLRVAVLEKALEEVSRKAHAANNRRQAVVGVCETVIKWLRRANREDASLAQVMLETALGGEGVGVLEKVAAEAAQAERAAIIRKIRQDAKISHGLARFTGGGFLGVDLDGLADDLEAGAREQTGGDDGPG